MYITIDGVSIHYQQQGGGPQTVVLLHGWGCDAGFFDPIAKELAKDARVVALDFPGHGKSGRPPEPWGTKEFSEMVTHFMDALFIQRAVVVGHSHGGRVALHMAANHPEKLEKLVITGGAGLRKPPTEVQQRRSAEYAKKRALYEKFKAMKIFGPLPDYLAEKLRQKYGSADYKALDSEMRKTFVKVVNDDMGPYLAKVAAPTLLIWGQNDTETPLWMGETMEKEIPDAGLVVFENGTHYAHIEQWQRFSKIVSHFMKGA